MAFTDEESCYCQNLAGNNVLSLSSKVGKSSRKDWFESYEAIGQVVIMASFSFCSGCILDAFAPPVEWMLLLPSVANHFRICRSDITA